MWTSLHGFRGRQQSMTPTWMSGRPLRVRGPGSYNSNETHRFMICRDRCCTRSIEVLSCETVASWVCLCFQVVVAALAPLQESTAPACGLVCHMQSARVKDSPSIYAASPLHFSRGEEAVWERQPQAFRLEVEEEDDDRWCALGTSLAAGSCGLGSDQ